MTKSTEKLEPNAFKPLCTIFKIEFATLALLVEIFNTVKILGNFLLHSTFKLGKIEEENGVKVTKPAIGLSFPFGAILAPKNLINWAPDKLEHKFPYISLANTFTINELPALVVDCVDLTEYLYGTPGETKNALDSPILPVKLLVFNELANAAITIPDSLLIYDQLVNITKF
ncbi:hypothetical protein AQBE111736_14005 [Aquirufa beregesia]